MQSIFGALERGAERYWVFKMLFEYKAVIFWFQNLLQLKTICLWLYKSGNCQFPVSEALKEQGI